MTTIGVLYVATGSTYIRSAMRSAESLRRHCPDLPCHLFGDWEVHGFNFDRDPSPFSSVALVESPHRRSKVDYLGRSPFDWTLYLDSDTAVVEDIREMFGLLERFDIAMTHAHHRHSGAGRGTWRIQLPPAFPQYNTGVVLYRKTPEVLAFLEEWQAQYNSNVDAVPHDQVTLRELLWLSQLRLATLPPEYNVRFVKYHFLWSRAEAVTKIFHLQRYRMGWLPWMFRGLGKWQRRIARNVRKLKAILVGAATDGPP